MALSGTGLFTPEASISNEELVASFNEYARRHNRLLAEVARDFIRNSGVAVDAIAGPPAR